MGHQPFIFPSSFPGFGIITTLDCCHSFGIVPLIKFYTTSRMSYKPSLRSRTRLISLYLIPSSSGAGLLDVPAKTFLTKSSIFSCLILVNLRYLSLSSYISSTFLPSFLYPKWSLIRPFFFSLPVLRGVPIVSVRSPIVALRCHGSLAHLTISYVSFSPFSSQKA